jgi:predicted O-methyltransferase YrrM
MIPDVPERRLSGTVALMDPVDALVSRLLVEEPIGFDPHDTPPIAVSAAQGKFLALLARATGAKRVLELGTLAGYSTIWLAAGVGPDGLVVTVELDQRHADVAAANFERAGVADRVVGHVGPALDVIPALTGPFDLAFLDADKRTMPQQIELVVPLLRPGAVLICDNVVRGGAVADPTPGDESAIGVRTALELLAADPRLDATVLQTVGAKGHDGFAFAVLHG